ncbi:hypothetical protein [Rhodococcus sp. A14]|uniref:hypothetical protein n=1 Tax=Rhodococcus sp. A14 TaxID=1194106 RepID=UPI00141E4248|nr:hypothetical protein [Rhodococcus sp. A14]
MDTASTCTRPGFSRRAGCSHVCSPTARRELEEHDDYTAAWAVTQILPTGNGADRQNRTLPPGSFTAVLDLPTHTTEGC